MADFWIVDPDTRTLVSPYQDHPKAKRIVAAQPFSASILSLVVAEDLDSWLRGKNDILVLTKAALGDQPLVERVHYYKEEVKKGKPIKNLLAESIYVASDYSGEDKLWLELNVLEIDTDTGERKAAVQAFQAMASTAGAVFPAILPYSMAASAVANVVEKLVSALEKDEEVVKMPVAFYPGKARPGRAPFQEGTFVAFNQPIPDPSKFKLQPNGLLTSGKRPSEISYIVFDLFAEKKVSPKFEMTQKVATLLTLIRDSNRNATKSTFDFLSNTLTSYSNFRKLERYIELKEKGKDATKEEKELMAEIKKIDELKAFIPKA